MNPDSLLPPLEVRFVDPQDVEKYGADWYTYDELAIVTQPARDLVRIEQEMDAVLVDVMNGVRANSIFGDTAAAWLALRAAGRTVAFEEFSPIIMLAIWRRRPEEESGKSEAPDTSEPASPPTSTAGGSTPTATVALATMPAAG